MIKKIIFIVWAGYFSLAFALKHDPTMPVAGIYVPLESDKIHVAGIIMHGEVAHAYINDHLFGVGDSVSGYKITQISDNQVFFSDEKGNYVVPLHKSVKTISTDSK